MKWKLFFIVAILFLVVTENSFAKGKNKKITISGYIIDGNDKPLEGVSIIVDGVTLRKVTNAKGFYKIKVNPDIKTIMVYSLFHGGLEVEFTGKTNIDFILAPSTTDGEFISKEKLVDIGYGSVMKKENLSYSVGGIENEESKTPKYSSIFDMIAGQVPGVVVNGRSITIRGAATVMGSSEPLFVVDNISTESIDMINPSDVKSIDVLKGSAAAIYGTRGSNGVILIKTKKGSNN